MTDADIEAIEARADAALRPIMRCKICGAAIPDGHACLLRADGDTICLGCESHTHLNTLRALYEVTDGSMCWWVSARGPKEAMAAVEATDGYEPCEQALRARQLHGGDCIDKRFDFADGDSCSMWNAFELARAATQVFGCSEW